MVGTQPEQRPGRIPGLAPFRVRSFRFQWPADLLTSWAFEMENIILGAYIYAATQDVVLLTVFGALQFLGTLLAPILGVMADRVGARRMLCGLRATFCSLAAILMVLGLMDLVHPYWVFAVAVPMGMVRPSDLVMRNTLIGTVMPPRYLASAMGLMRTTMDSARAAGALLGTNLLVWVGFGVAYVAVTLFYLVSTLLTLGVDRGLTRVDPQPTSPWRDLRDGMAHVWTTPAVRAAMLLAFLVNFTAFPWVTTLMPYVAAEVYGVSATGLGHLVASLATGALLGSLLMTQGFGRRHPGACTIFGTLLWHVLLLVFGWVADKTLGMALLAMIGAVQSVAMISLLIIVLGHAKPEMRGRVMGVRMFAVYGLPLGMLLAGKLVAELGFTTAVASYAVLGLLATAAIGMRWRRAFFG